MSNTKIDLILENGIKKHQENNLIEASNCYESVLKLDNKNLKANLLILILAI